MSTARRQAASDFRRVLSTCTNLKFLRVPHALFVNDYADETKTFGDFMTEFLPASVEHLEVAVFNHGINAWIFDWNIDWSLHYFFKTLGLWSRQLNDKEYRGWFRASYPTLEKFGILVHNKGNRIDLTEFWNYHREANYYRLMEWLVYGDNFSERHSHYGYYHNNPGLGIPEGWYEEDDLSDDGLPEGRYDEDYLPDDELPADEAEDDHLGPENEVEETSAGDDAVEDEELPGNNGDDEFVLVEQEVEQDFPEDDAAGPAGDGYHQVGTLEDLHRHLEGMGADFVVSTFQWQHIDVLRARREGEVMTLVPQARQDEFHPLKRLDR